MDVHDRFVLEGWQSIAEKPKQGRNTRIIKFSFESESARVFECVGDAESCHENLSQKFVHDHEGKYFPSINEFIEMFFKEK